MGGLAPVCAGFVTAGAVPYVEPSNDMALAHRHSFHGLKINHVCKLQHKTISTSCQQLSLLPAGVKWWPTKSFEDTDIKTSWGNIT